MSVRKQEEKNIRKITKVGKTSLSVTLPIELVRELKWKERQKIKVSRVRGGLLIKDWIKAKS
jgi:antitoxin component of MazEF toxin-antitoxin module